MSNPGYNRGPTGRSRRTENRNVNQKNTESDTSYTSTRDKSHEEGFQTHRTFGNTSQPYAQTQFPNTDTKEMHTLMECMSICEACARKCIEEGHKNTAIICTECAKLCDVAIQFKSFGSRWQNQVLGLCAQVCQACADECGRMSAAHCKECADICRRCQEICTPAYSSRY